MHLLSDVNIHTNIKLSRLLIILHLEEKDVIQAQQLWQPA